MTISCAVRGCKNNNRNSKYSFVGFPAIRQNVIIAKQGLVLTRLAKWMNACQRVKPPNNHVRICVKHFVNGCPAALDDVDNVDWVPTLFLPDAPVQPELIGTAVCPCSAPSAMSGCALGCIASGKVLFDIPTSKNKKLSSIRTSRWKAILKIDVASSSKQNTRVCSEHFFLKQPAVVEDKDNPDWLPWLRLNPKIQDDPVQVQQRMQQYYEAQHKFGKQICSIASCSNHNEKLAPVMPLYDFPALETSSYTRRVLSERRLLTWIQVIQQPDLWDRFDIHTMKICGKHFVSGQMAKLTDVENIDWIPTQGLSRSLGFNDHVAHFDLHNIVSLALEDAESIAQEETIFSDEEDCMEQPEEQKRVSVPKVVIPPPLPKPQVNVGFKCILCLGNAALKPLTSADKAALDELFKDKLCVQSELICRKCCTHITDFHAFHVSIVKIQQGAITKKIKTILPVPDRKPPVPKKNGGSLFTICSPDKFQCNLCKAVLVGKDLLNKHLYLQHKIKINCKLCKTSFSPDGYAAHRATCGSAKPAKSNRYVPVKDRLANTTITPVEASNSTEKYSCYICTQFFTPNEMREHIKTHDDVIKSARGRVAPQVVFDEQYEACKRCSRAVHKDDREKHQQQHDEERERLRELISKQQATNPHKCVPCRQSFTSLIQLQKHRELHDVHSCDECSEEFGNANQLKAHKKRAHDGDGDDDDEPGQQQQQTASEVQTGAETDDLIEEDFEEEHLVDDEFQPEVYVESAFQPDV